MANNIPITNGQGQSSVAAEEIGSLKYQQIKVVGGETGSSSVWSIGPDGSAKVSIVGTVQVSGTFTTANQSVSGTVGASVMGQLPGGTAVLGSIATLQGTNPWIITGSVQGTVSVGNSSVQVINFPTTQNISGSVAAWLQSTNASVITVGTAVANQSVSGTVNIGNFPTTQNVSGSVAAWIQSTNASVITVGTPVANQSVSGTVGASVVGHAPVVIVGGSILTSSTANQSVSGTVGVRLESTNASVITVTQSSIAAVIVGGSVATATTNSSVMLLNSPNVIGSVATLQGTNPWIITGSVQGTFAPGNSSVQVLNFPTTQNVSGSVVAFQGTTEWTVKSSISGGIFPVSGSVAAVITNTNVNVSGSVAAFVVGNASLIALIQGSVSAVRNGQIGTVITSISGIPQASVHGAVSVAGGLIQASVHGAVTFQQASLVSGHGSVNGAASVQIFAAPGTGLHNYITDFTISNTGAATTLVTFTDGDGSVLGKTIAPAGGGSNATALSSPMRTMQTNKVVNISAATATSVLHAWLGGYKAP